MVTQITPKYICKFFYITTKFVCFDVNFFLFICDRNRHGNRHANQNVSYRHSGNKRHIRYNFFNETIVIHYR